MITPESIFYLFETGEKTKQEDFIWPAPGNATVNDQVFIVCDGAGSFENGEIASQLISQFMAAKILKYPENRMSTELINKLLIEGRERLITYAREYKLDTDLATTFSMLVLYDQRAMISWYGDSKVYHVRNGEILFKTEDNALVGELVQLSEISSEGEHVHSGSNNVFHGIKADSASIYAETRWIDDVQDGDYFLLCTKGLCEVMTDEDVTSLLGSNQPSNGDLAESFKQLVVGKTMENYSMYLIRARVGVQRRTAVKHVTVSAPPRRPISTVPSSGSVRTPIIILTLMIVGLSILFIYFRGRNSATVPKYSNPTSQPVDAVRHDSVPSAINRGLKRPATTAATTAAPAVTDSGKTKNENPPPTPQPVQQPPPTAQKDDDADIQPEEKPARASQPALGLKKPAQQRNNAGLRLVQSRHDTRRPLAESARETPTSPAHPATGCRPVAGNRSGHAGPDG